MPLSPATRSKLGKAGTAALVAALGRKDLPNRRLDGLRPLSPTQDTLVGEASPAIETCRAGSVLVLDIGRPLPPLGLLVRRGIAGIVSAAPLRQMAEIVRGGIPAFQRAPGAAKPLGIDGDTILVGDRAGLIAIPADCVDEIAEAAIEALAFEEFIAEQVNQGGGVYGLHIPSGDRARAAFAAWRKMRGR